MDVPRHFEYCEQSGRFVSEEKNGYSASDGEIACATYTHPVDDPEDTKFAAFLETTVLVGPICNLVRVCDAVIRVAPALVHVLEPQPMADFVDQRRALEHRHCPRFETAGLVGCLHEQRRGRRG